MSFSYNTRMTSLRMGRGGNKNTSEPLTARRQLHYSTDKYRTSPVYLSSGVNKVRRSNLGRRKSLGLNLKPATVAMQVNSLIPESQITSSNSTSQQASQNYIYPSVKRRILKPNDQVGFMSSSHSINAKISGPTSNKLCLAIPLATLHETPASIENISKESTSKVPKECTTKQGTDSFDSMDDFLSSEAKIVEENVDVDAVVPTGTLNGTSADIQQAVTNNSGSTVALKEQLDYESEKKTPVKSNVENLVKSLLTKLEEYDKLMTDARNKYKEIENIKQLIERSNSKEYDVNCEGTGSKSHSCLKKSVKKFYNVSIKCNTDIIPTFTAPKTPPSVKKSVTWKRKSVGYTPRSLKKVLNQQLEDLCDS